MWKRPSYQAVEAAEGGGAASAWKAQSPAISPADKRRDVALMFTSNLESQPFRDRAAALAAHTPSTPRVPARRKCLLPPLYSSAISVDMEGGASSGALPHWGLGAGPISRVSVPPLAISLCRNHGLSSGRPFSWADWMYLFCAET